MAHNQNECGQVCWPERPRKYIELESILPSVDIQRNQDVPSRDNEMLRVDIDIDGLDKDRTHQDTHLIEEFYKTMQVETNVPNSRGTSGGSSGSSPLIINRKGLGDASPKPTRKSMVLESPTSVDRSSINKKKNRRSTSGINELKKSMSVPNSPMIPPSV